MIPFDTYIILLEDFQILPKLCDLRNMFSCISEWSAVALEARWNRLPSKLSLPHTAPQLRFLVVQFLGSQSSRWRNIKVVKAMKSMLHDVSFYKCCFLSFKLPRDDIIASAERLYLKNSVCDYKLSEQCQKATCRKGSEQLLWMSFNHSNHISKQSL